MLTWGVARIEVEPDYCPGQTYILLAGAGDGGKISLPDTSSVSLSRQLPIVAYKVGKAG